MKRIFSRSILVAGLALIAVAWAATTVQAQPPRFRYYGSGRPFPVVQNMYQPFVPTLLQQSAFRQYNRDLRVIGRTYAQFPPWVFGYNPYPQVVNYGPVYRYPTYPVYPNYVYPTYPTGGYTSPY